MFTLKLTAKITNEKVFRLKLCLCMTEMNHLICLFDISRSYLGCLTNYFTCINFFQLNNTRNEYISHHALQNISANYNGLVIFRLKRKYIQCGNFKKRF